MWKLTGYGLATFAFWLALATLAPLLFGLGAAHAQGQGSGDGGGGGGCSDCNTSNRGGK